MFPRSRLQSISTLPLDGLPRFGLVRSDGRTGPCRTLSSSSVGTVWYQDCPFFHILEYPAAPSPSRGQCWWYRYRTQTREHLFRVCPEWEAQQKILWAGVQKKTGRWKSRWKIRDLLADERCSRAVLDSLASTDVAKRVPAEEDTERGVGGRAAGEGGGAGGGG